MEINGFEEGGPKWTMPRTIICGKEQGFERERRKGTYRCMPLAFVSFFLSYSLFSFLSFFSPCSLLFFSLILFLVISTIVIFQHCVSSLFLYISLLLFRPCTQQRTPFYSACCNWILLFYPLTTFVWSGCTRRPLLFRLRATPHYQTKTTILSVSLSWLFFLPRCYFSLSLSLMACT